MSKKGIWVMRTYIVLCFFILLACIIMLGVDLGNYVNSGEFEIFKEFNMVKYRVTDIPYENVEAAVCGYKDLYSSGYQQNSLQHLLLSFSLYVGQLNLVVLYIHKWCKIKMQIWSKYIIGVQFVLTVVLIIGIRLAMDSSWGRPIIMALYPAAYWLFQP